MKKLEWTIEERNISDLKAADYNPRKMSDQERADLTASIDEFGAAVPLVVNTGKRNNVLIGGHQRTQIYKDKGIAKVNVAVPSRELTMAEEKKLNLRLNKNTGSWDFDKLGMLELETLIEVGFGDEELATLWDDVDMLEDGYDVNQAVKSIDVPVSRPGDIYELGDHRVMCGEATDQDAIRELVGAQRATLLWVDPPKPQRRSKHEYELPVLAVEVAGEFMNPNAHTFLWTEDTLIPYLVNTLASDFVHKATLLWIRERLTINPKVAFTSAYEPCIYGTSGKASFGGMHDKSTSVLNKVVGGDNQFHEDLRDMTDLWLDKEDTAQKNDRPVTLAEKPLKRCSTPGDTVLVPFGRAGAMIIAAEQIKRKALVMQKDPVLVDVIVNRWETFTNKKAKKHAA